jgi:hypothetical protein
MDGRTGSVLAAWVGRSISGQWASLRAGALCCGASATSYPPCLYLRARAPRLTLPLPPLPHLAHAHCPNIKDGVSRRARLRRDALLYLLLYAHTRCAQRILLLEERIFVYGQLVVPVKYQRIEGVTAASISAMAAALASADDGIGQAKEHPAKYRHRWRRKIKRAYELRLFRQARPPPRVRQTLVRRKTSFARMVLVNGAAASDRICDAFGCGRCCWGGLMDRAASSLDATARHCDAGTLARINRRRQNERRGEAKSEPRRGVKSAWRENRRRQIPRAQTMFLGRAALTSGAKTRMAAASRNGGGLRRGKTAWRGAPAAASAARKQASASGGALLMAALRRTLLRSGIKAKTKKKPRYRRENTSSEKNENMNMRCCAEDEAGVRTCCCRTSSRNIAFSASAKGSQAKNEKTGGSMAA